MRSTLFSKNCIPLYLKDLKFLIERLGWVVTKIYAQFTFEQLRYKKDLILKNQHLHRNLQNKIEKSFYKLLNNANYGHDCRSNLDNCKFELIFDELDEVTYNKKYHNVFDQKMLLILSYSREKLKITMHENSLRQKKTMFLDQ